MFKITMPSLCFSSFAVMHDGISLINIESLDNLLLEKFIPAEIEQPSHENLTLKEILFHDKLYTITYYNIHIFLFVFI